MGCWSSKEANRKSYLPEVVLESPEARKLPWSAQATQWRWLLRTTQSLVAAALYSMSTLLRPPSLPVFFQMFVALLVAPPFTLAYHLLSMNQAGGYYATYLEMFTELPQHIRDIQRRESSEYRTEIEHERRDGIVRTVNGLESGMVFITVSWIAALCSSTRHNLDFTSDFTWRCTETFFMLGIHRLIGANVFDGRYRGLLQPEAMWYFESYVNSRGGVDCRMIPLEQHPDPSY